MRDEGCVMRDEQDDGLRQRLIYSRFLLQSVTRLGHVRKEFE